MIVTYTSRNAFSVVFSVDKQVSAGNLSILAILTISAKHLSATKHSQVHMCLDNYTIFIMLAQIWGFG